MKVIILLIPFLIILIGCHGLDEQLLVGEWQASSILEDGKILEIDYSPVSFLFSKDGFYSFNSTIDYKEAGSYYLNGNLLFTTDTLNAASVEKAVQVANLSQDSLVLEMLADGKPKVMHLFRVK